MVPLDSFWHLAQTMLKSREKLIKFVEIREEVAIGRTRGGFLRIEVKVEPLC